MPEHLAEDDAVTHDAGPAPWLGLGLGSGLRVRARVNSRVRVGAGPCVEEEAQLVSA